MGKENWSISSFWKKSANRYNPYATPVYLRPLKESRLFGFSRRDPISWDQPDLNCVDVDALTEYQTFLKKVNFDNDYIPNTSTPISSQNFNRSRFSPGFPLKQLKMQRDHDVLLKKLSNLKNKIKEIPDTFRTSDIAFSNDCLFPMAHNSAENLDIEILESTVHSSQTNFHHSIANYSGYQSKPITKLLNRNSGLFSSLRDDDKNELLINEPFAGYSRNQKSSLFSNFSGTANNDRNTLFSSLLRSMNPNKKATVNALTKIDSSSKNEFKDFLLKTNKNRSTTHLPSFFNRNPFRFNAAPSPRENVSSTLKTSPLVSPISDNLDSSYNSLLNEKHVYINSQSTPNLTKTSLSSLMFSKTSQNKAEAKKHDIKRDTSGSLLDVSTLTGRNYPLIEDSTKVYRDKKYHDEEKQRLLQIRELENEARQRSKARLNRQILSEEYRRLRLELEGLILERRPKEEQFPNLPDDAEELLERAWNRHASFDEVFIKAFGIDVTRKDLLSLSGLEWLNDEIVNFYMNLIMERSRQNTNLPKVYAFSTFFYPNISMKGYDSVKRWTRKVDIFSFDLIIVPVHLTAHWCLATVNVKDNIINYYDSMLGNNDRCLNMIKDYLASEYLNKKNAQLDINGWRLNCLKDIPRQLNGSDCGMFACQFAEYASRKAEINFTQSHMQYFRQRMVYEICKETLL